MWFLNNRPRQICLGFLKIKKLFEIIKSMLYNENENTKIIL